VSVDFRTLLVEHEQKQLYFTTHDLVRYARMFEAVKLLPQREEEEPRIEISVQASGMHYSSPRKVLPVDRYSTWEVAIMCDGIIINPRILPWLPEQLATAWEDEERPVGAYLPTATVQAVFDAAELARARLEVGDCTHEDCCTHTNLADACVLQRWEDLKNNHPGEP